MNNTKQIKKMVKIV